MYCIRTTADRAHKSPSMFGTGGFLSFSHAPPHIAGTIFLPIHTIHNSFGLFCFLIIAPNESGNHVFLRDFFLTFLNFCKRETAMVKIPWLFIVPAQIHFQYYTLSLRYSCGVMPVTRLNSIAKFSLAFVLMVYYFWFLFVSMHFLTASTESKCAKAHMSFITRNSVVWSPATMIFCFAKLLPTA